MGNSQSNRNDSPTASAPATPTHHHARTSSQETRTTSATPTQLGIQTATFTGTGTTAAQATSRGSSYRSSQFQTKPETPRPAFQNVKHSANNYVIPAAKSKNRKNPWEIIPCQNRMLILQRLRVCPQYNGQSCVVEQCRRLHVCLFWGTKTCYKTSCKCDHSFDSVHNTRLIEACGMRQELLLDDSLSTSLRHKEEEICLFSVLRKCSKEPCTRVHSVKKYMWQVQDDSGWIQMSYSQSDYLELMYSDPHEECVDLIPLQTHMVKNRNLQRLAKLISTETSWSADLEAFKLKGTSSVHDIRRLSTTSDLTSSVPAATRWLWYWQDDDGCWEAYGEGGDKKYYFVALSDHLEHMLRAQNKRFVTIDMGRFTYSIDGKKMTQTNITTGKTRRIRRRPAYSLVRQADAKFDELFLPQPATKKFLKLPVMPLSPEFLFVENLLKQTLVGLRITSIHRVQNDHLWKVYQNKKRLLISLYNGDVTATNEQYLFHGTRLDVVDHICKDNLDWKLWGTNVGHSYGKGTYFSNMANLAHQYGRSNRTDKKVMLVVLVLVGKMTRGHTNMEFPPMNDSTGRRYDTTCNMDTNASIFVKYERDEYYPAYVVRYSCD